MQIIRTTHGVHIETTAAELKELAHQMALVESGAPVLVTAQGQTHVATYAGTVDRHLIVDFHTTKPKQ